MIRNASGKYSTRRFHLRPPQPSDAEPIFTRYASDPEVVGYLSWPRHQTIADTHAFIEYSRGHWAEWSCGPLLIEDNVTGELLGSTGLTCDSATRAASGWALARNAWGKGIAPEVMGAMVTMARDLGIGDLYALCHVDHVRSRRALERSGFVLRVVRPGAAVFPNLGTPEAQDVCHYTWGDVGQPLMVAKGLFTHD